jgi:pyrroloquinoline quinone biosynthesis protein B
MGHHTIDQRTVHMQPFAVVLGIAQDGGFPQTGCRRECCSSAWEDVDKKRHVASIAVLDPETSQRWIIDATLDFKEQLRMLDKVHCVTSSPGISGIFLTHGHIGHYAGLLQLGKEVMGTDGLAVHVMPRMARFLEGNSPWERLVRQRHISLQPLRENRAEPLNPRLSVTPIPVPHRDEYTETVGYRISGPTKSLLYVPDTDNWDGWTTPIEELIAEVDAAFIDGTFFSNREVAGRCMEGIPHPFISETIARFAALPAPEKAKISFIHLNHTNPALIPDSQATKTVLEAGFIVAEELCRFLL